MKSGKFILWLWMFWPAACAHGWEGNHRGAYEVNLVVGGRELPVYHHRGRAFVEGRRGERYVIRIHNRSPRRIEAVISVDGRDVIDGRPASLSKRGYVIMPWSSADIDGFRLSMHRVAAFRFSEVEDSYAARMGSAWRVGVVAVAIFPERRYQPRPPPPYVLDDAREKSAAPRAGTAGEYYGRSRSRNLGTEFAEPRWSPAVETDFVRENFSRPAARLAIRYDDREGLCNVGLSFLCRPYSPAYPPTWPPAYPPEPPPPGPFAEPPPGWEHFSHWY